MKLTRLSCAVHVQWYDNLQGISGFLLFSWSIQILLPYSKENFLSLKTQNHPALSFFSPKVDTVSMGYWFWKVFWCIQMWPGSCLEGTYSLVEGGGGRCLIKQESMWLTAPNGWVRGNGKQVLLCWGYSRWQQSWERGMDTAGEELAEWWKERNLRSGVMMRGR